MQGFVVHLTELVRRVEVRKRRVRFTQGGVDHTQDRLVQRTRQAFYHLHLEGTIGRELQVLRRRSWVVVAGDAVGDAFLTAWVTFVALVKASCKAVDGDLWLAWGDEAYLDPSELAVAAAAA